MDDTTAGLLMELGKAANLNGEVSETWRSFRQAFDYYERTGNVARAVDVAYAVGLSQLLVRPSQTQLIERALRLVEPGTEEYARLNVALATSVGFMGQFERALECYASAEAIARTLGLRQLELDILSRWQYVVGFQLRLDEALAMGDRTIALAQELNDLHAEAITRFFNHGQYWVGNLERAEQNAEAGRALAERMRIPYSIASAAYSVANIAYVKGDWAAAREAISWGMDAGAPDPRILALAASIAYQLGDVETARAALRQTGDFVQTTPPGPTIDYAQLAAVAARATLIDGREPDRDLIRRVSKAMLESPVPCTPLLRSYALGALAVLAHVEHDRSLAERILPGLEELDSYAQEHVLATDHARALVLEECDRVDDAIEAVEKALAFLPAAYRPHRAEAAYDCARLRLQRDAPGDRERARALIDEALGYARTLTMRPLADKLVALKLEEQGISTIGDIYTSIDRVASEVERERPDVSVRPAPDGTVTLMFSDIEDSTILTERLGDQAWQALLRKHNALIRQQLKAHDGYEVKTMGDGFMVAFQSAKKGLECAVAIQRAFDAHNAANGEVVKVRIGLHAGEAIKDGDDFYGKNVILASRVAGKAVGGEILVSSLVRALVESSVGPGTFSAPREVELKGLAGTHTVYAVSAT